MDDRHFNGHTERMELHGCNVHINGHADFVNAYNCEIHVNGKVDFVNKYIQGGVKPVIHERIVKVKDEQRERELERELAEVRKAKAHLEEELAAAKAREVQNNATREIQDSETRDLQDKVDILMMINRRQANRIAQLERQAEEERNEDVRARTEEPTRGDIYFINRNALLYLGDELLDLADSIMPEWWRRQHGIK